MRPKYHLERFANGSQSLFDSEFGQTMHSMIGPDAEAQAIYINPSRLSQRLTQVTPPSPSSPHALSLVIPLVIYDVGLGVAANALAALAMFERMNQNPNTKTRDLHLISFETEPQGLLFALQNSEAFPHFRNYHVHLKNLLDQKSVSLQQRSGARVHWELRVGDFRELLETAPSPEIIFYDLYSPQSCPELWGFHTFQLLYKKTKEPKDAGLNTFLSTYSVSTAARTSLLLAGFHVGYGEETEAKRETTLASTERGDLVRPLDLKWYEHWQRSSHPLPSDCKLSRTEVSLLLHQLPNFNLSHYSRNPL